MVGNPNHDKAGLFSSGTGGGSPKSSSQGNRAVAKHVVKQHEVAKVENEKSSGSFVGHVAKGAAIGSAVGGAAGALALRQFGGAKIGAKLGAAAGAKTGAIAGGVYHYATKKGK